MTAASRITFDSYECDGVALAVDIRVYDSHCSAAVMLNGVRAKSTRCRDLANAMRWGQRETATLAAVMAPSPQQLSFFM